MRPCEVRDEWVALAEETRARKRNELYALGLPPSGGLEDACMAHALAAVLPLAVAEEREACAAYLDSIGGYAATSFAAAIRSRGEPR